MKTHRRIDRALDFFFLKNVEKKTLLEIAREHNVSMRTVQRYLKFIKHTLRLTEQQKEDIIFFYENEMKNLMKMRENTVDKTRIYLQITDRILALQDKITELLSLKAIKLEHSGKIEGGETKVIIVHPPRKDEENRGNSQTVSIRLPNQQG